MTDKIIIAGKPKTKQTLVKHQSQQQVILPDGSTGKLLVIQDNGERYSSFVMIHKDSGRRAGDMDDASLGLFYKLATMFADYKNLCPVTSEEIVEVTGVSRKTVESRLRKLVKAGYIKRIRNGLYMISPWRATQISKKYLPALESAWKTGRVDSIERDIAKIDADAKHKQQQNKKEVRQANLSPVIIRETIPEAVDIDDYAERQAYIADVKGAEKIAARLDRIARAK